MPSSYIAVPVIVSFFHNSLIVSIEGKVMLVKKKINAVVKNKCFPENDTDFLRLKTGYM